MQAVLNLLEALFYLILTVGSVVVKRIPVIKFGVNDMEVAMVQAVVESEYGRI